VRSKIVELAQSFIGTPFVHQGRVPGHGLDCVGILAIIGQDLGLMSYDETVYPREPDGKRLRLGLEQHYIRVLLDEVQPGDILLFWIGSNQRPQHVGIRTQTGLVHAHSSLGRVVEHGFSPRWQRQVVAAYKFPGVD